MKYTQAIRQTTRCVSKIECDRCKKQFTASDWIEWQEMVSIHSVGGYGSVFGDGATIELDLCQACFKLLCGEYITLT